MALSNHKTISAAFFFFCLFVPTAENSFREALGHARLDDAPLRPTVLRPWGYLARLFTRPEDEHGGVPACPHLCRAKGLLGGAGNPAPRCPPVMTLSLSPGAWHVRSASNAV